MNDAASEGVVVPLHPGGTERRTDTWNGRIVIEQAKGAISARQGITPDIAFEMLRGLARSQGRDIDEFAAAVVANGGRLDV